LKSGKTTYISHALKLIARNLAVDAFSAEGQRGNQRSISYDVLSSLRKRGFVDDKTRFNLVDTPGFEAEASGSMDVWGEGAFLNFIDGHMGKDACNSSLSLRDR
jgi:hypothetical protein